eukprot:TRINITY_DN5036_c0_g1_i8.p3 TRINITY_DN5036_c0_g1~~TRINITY_DN5036_c0_g1_i8.p3  ORF type:complete len:108 (+),score=15.85 TRINITY_DN5036_c0_g1_i8:790-1113(+)
MEEVRECIGGDYAGMRLSMTSKKQRYPNLDCSLIQNDQDTLWNENHEKLGAVIKRSQLFINWMWTRSERHITLVSHEGFIAILLLLLLEKRIFLKNAECVEIFVVKK